jgi:TRAP-type mannitol/chloroaromatic compound transport system permease large subunit
MKGALAVIAAGGTFAGTVVVAIIIGVVLDQRLGRSDLIVYAFFAGLVVGAYAAWRLVAPAILQ